ncbi:Bud site selection protein bud4 [Mycoemilia scoparia]|uniref:Bud site selection protein bud4 n=1 Tax=Mycoemilia scoparia TaxID=417184 RepID=A0A9W7ZV98_9FUNG|nr:Bud site selection protein bud4 [Mycoemilia scoparia]
MSSPGLKAPTHIDFQKPSSLPSSTNKPPDQSIAASNPHQNRNSMYSEESYTTTTSEAQSGSSDHHQHHEATVKARWFSAIRDGKLIPIESMLKEHPNVMDLQCSDPTPFHSMLQMLASDSLGNDTTNMDGLQIAIMEYKNAYARWRLGSADAGGGGGASQDKQREQINVREAILSEMLVAVTPQQLDSHRFGYYKNTTLHLAAFFNDNNLVNRLLIQGANPSIRNGMGNYPLSTTTDSEVRISLQKYTNIAYHQHLHSQYHDPNLDIAAGYAQSHMAQQQQQQQQGAIAVGGSQNVGYMDSEQIVSDYDEEEEEEEGTGHGDRSSSDESSGGYNHNNGQTYYDSYGLEGQKGGSIDYGVHLKPLPSRLSTVIEESIEDDMHLLNSDARNQNTGDHRSSMSGPFSIPSMDPISEISEDSHHNDEHDNTAQQEPSAMHDRNKSQFQHQTAIPAPASATNIFESSGANIRRIDSRGSIPSGSEMTTGADTEFYSCNEYDDKSATGTPNTPVKPASAASAKHELVGSNRTVTATDATAVSSSNFHELDKQNERAAGKRGAESDVHSGDNDSQPDSDAEEDRLSSSQPSRYSTIRDQTFSSVSSISYNGSTIRRHRRRKMRKSDESSLRTNDDDDDDDPNEDEDDIDCSGIDDILDDLHSESGGSGYFNRSEGLTSAVTFYSSQGLGERKLSTRKGQASQPPLVTATTATTPKLTDGGGGGGGGDTNSRKSEAMNINYRSRNDEPDTASSTQKTVGGRRPLSALAATPSSRPLSFSHDLYDMIMSKAPHEVRSKSSLSNPITTAPAAIYNTALVASPVTTADVPNGQDDDDHIVSALYQISKSNVVTKPDSGNNFSELSAIPETLEHSDAAISSKPMTRIGRRQGREAAIELGLSSQHGKFDVESNNKSDSVVDIEQPSRPQSKTSEIPGEAELYDNDDDDGYEDTANGNFSEGGDLSRSNSLSYGPSNADIANELMNIPLTLESRDAIINSLVKRFGKNSEKKLQRIVDDELRVRNESATDSDRATLQDGHDNTVRSLAARSSISSISDALKDLLPVVSAGSGDASETFRIRPNAYNRSQTRIGAANSNSDRTSSVNPLAGFFRPSDEPALNEGNSERKDTHKSDTNRRVTNNSGLPTPPQLCFHDDGDLSGSEGDCEDNVGMGLNATARRQRPRSKSRSRSHSRSRRSSLASATNSPDNQTQRKPSSLGVEVATPAINSAAQSPRKQYPTSMSVQGTSPVHTSSPRKVSPSLQILQEKAFVSSAFGRSPNRSTLSNPSSGNTSISSTSGGIAKAHSRQSTHFPPNITTTSASGEDRANNRPHSGSISSLLSNSSSASSPFGVGSHLASSPKVGRVAAFKRQFEQQISASGSGSGSSNHSSFSSPSSSTSSFRSTNNSNNQPSSPLKSKDRLSAIQKIGQGSRPASPSVLSSAPYSQHNMDVRPTSTPKAPTAQHPARDSNVSTEDIRSQLPSKDSDNKSSAGSSIPSIFTSSNTINEEYDSPDSQAISELSQPPHYGSPRERARRRQSNTLKAIQNSGIVRGRLQVFTASNPLIYEQQHTRPGSSASSVDRLSKHITTDYSQRGKRYLETELGMDISPSSSPPENFPPVTRDPTSTSMDRQTNTSSSPILTRTTVDLNELLEANRRESGINTDAVRSSDVPTVSTRRVSSSTAMSRPKLSITSEEWIEMANKSIGETVQQEIYSDDYLPINESEDNSTPEYYRYLKSRGVDDPEGYIEKHGTFGFGNNSPASLSNLGSRNSDDLSASGGKHDLATALEDNDGDDHQYHANTANIVQRQISQIAKGKMPAIDESDPEYQVPETAYGQPIYHSSNRRTTFSDRASTSLDRQMSGASNVSGSTPQRVLSMSSSDGGNNSTISNGNQTVKFDPRLAFGLSSSNDLLSTPPDGTPPSSFATKDTVSRFFSQQQQQSTNLSPPTSKPASGNDNNSSKHSSISTIYLQPFEGPSSDPTTPYNTYRGEPPEEPALGHDTLDPIPDDEEKYSTIKVIRTEDSDSGGGESRGISHPRQLNPWYEGDAGHGSSCGSQQPGRDADTAGTGESDSEMGQSEDMNDSRLIEGFDKPSSTALRYHETISDIKGKGPAKDQPHASKENVTTKEESVLSSTGPPAQPHLHEGSLVSMPSSSFEGQGRERSLSDFSMYSSSHPQPQQPPIEHRNAPSCPSPGSADTDLPPQSRVPSFEEEMQDTMKSIEAKASHSFRGSVNAKMVGKYRSKLDSQFVSSDNVNRISGSKYYRQFATAPPAPPLTPPSPNISHTPFINLIDGIPKGGFFALPQPKCQVGYLYLRILSMEDIRLSPQFLSTVESFYFVIRNGIHTLSCDIVPIKNARNGKILINQEFRISTNPKVSITMFLRVIHKPGYRGGIPSKPSKLFRSGRPETPLSAETSASGSNVGVGGLMYGTPYGLHNASSFQSGTSSQSSGEAGCLPILHRLLRKNTRSSRNRRSARQQQMDNGSQHDEETKTRYSTDIVMYHRPGGERGYAESFPRQDQNLDSNNNGGAGTPSRDVGNYPSAMIVVNGQQFPADPTPRNYSSAMMGPNGVQSNGSLNNLMAPGPLHHPQNRSHHNWGNKRGNGRHTNAPASVPGISKEETLGCAAVNVESMIDEVYLRTLVDGWEVEGTWDKKNKARLQLQMFFVPSIPGLSVESLPPTLSDCSNSIEIINWHNTTYCTGFLSQRGGDTKFWRRRYFKQVGCHLIAFHEESRQPRMFMDLNYATRVIDNSLNNTPGKRVKSTRATNAARLHAAATSEAARNYNSQHQHHLMVAQPPRRRNTHKRNNSDYSPRDSGFHAISPQLPHPTSPGLGQHYPNPAQFSEYASDGEDASGVDVQAHPHHYRGYGDNSSQDSNNSSGLDSGVYDVNRDSKQAKNSNHFSTSIQSINVSLHHGFSIEFGQAGWVEFYADSDEEKRTWVRNISQTISHSSKIPHWLIKILHTDLSEALDNSMSSISAITEPAAAAAAASVANSSSNSGQSSQDSYHHHHQQYSDQKPQPQQVYHYRT